MQPYCDRYYHHKAFLTNILELSTPSNAPKAYGATSI